MSKILLLGGTADGRQFANQLHNEAFNVVYSVAGLVRMPNVPCAVISGGFSQFGGICEYIGANDISLVLDMTHPYAQNITKQAYQASRELSIPYLRFQRPEWKPVKGDQWIERTSLQALFELTSQYKNIMIGVGQLDQEHFTQLRKIKHQVQLYRTAAKPKILIPETVNWLKAIGPFEFDAELLLLRKHNIEAVISKNSGGDSTYAKIKAARELSIPVYMLKRPTLPEGIQVMSQLQDCMMAVRRYL